MANLKCGDRLYRDIEAVIFDKDGTLANSHEYLRQVAVQRSTSLANMISDRAPADFTAQLLQAWGLREGQVHPSSMLAVGSRRDNEIVTAGFVATLDYDWIAALSLAESAFAVAAQAFPSKQTMTTVFPGVVPLLTALQAANIKLGILSADVLPNIEGFARHYQLDSFFDVYQGAEDGLSKPHPRLLQLACAGLGVAPGKTLVIGDSRADIELAKRGHAAGAIGVSWGWHSPFDIPNADIMLRSIDEVQVVGAW